MELIALAVISVAALLVAYLIVRDSSERAQRAEGTSHAIMALNVEMSKTLVHQCKDANDRYEKMANVLMEVSECAPNRVNLEARRLELQYDLETQRLERALNAERTNKEIEQVAPFENHNGSMSPTSMSMIED